MSSEYRAHYVKIMSDKLDSFGPDRQDVARFIEALRLERKGVGEFDGIPIDEYVDCLGQQLPAGARRQEAVDLAYEIALEFTSQEIR